jgi:hypothetical protein
MKKCLKCLLEKPLSDFGTRSRNSDGKRGRCKECEKIDRAAYLSTPEAQAITKAAAKNHYWRNRDVERKRQSEWAKNNQEHLFHYRRKALLAKYGITTEIYLSMLSAQGHSCKICGTKNPGTRCKFFFVDHCHRTGRVRGLLCAHCNLAIGQFGDKPDIIFRASVYVRQEGAI